MAETAFKPCGLSPSHAFMMMLVNNEPGIAAGSIATVLMLQPSTVTRLLDKLEKGKYLKRVIDGKYVSVVPLRKGVLMQNQIQQCWSVLYADYTGLLGKEQATRLTNQLYASSLKFENTVHSI
ncbi:MAG TPA: MarR family transcriptional regulator [Bacteroidia bacterium]|nr:MarR family transcriptional regulator [Bacteroidia bacterium]